jgi:manganese efflux pump family protein
MEWAALISWIVTAGGGFVLLAIWWSRGGMRQREGRQIRPPLILAHFGLAATGLVLWIIYVANDSDALAWIAFAILLAVALLGFTMFAIWWQRRQAATGPVPVAEEGSGGQPAEQHFPVPVVALHGLLAVTTVILVLLSALGV